ncbi:response regulator transcription factor [Lapidilactobacillus luobeiensis]|uniref:response regulator transcription factor n=1 Tax=Lapidilactobacillus luobeiensis TaxID=2950371 RepID=UPI0021C27A8F|nr:response regulator transcription factor [Lapidilactobacillus luobeiensis]
MTSTNILLIEDDQELALGIQRFLKNAATVQIETNGLTGQAAGETGAFDLVILDLMLPGKSGYEILKTWRQQDQLNLPVLILTAKDTLADKAQGFELGADDYLVKPFHREELLMRVKALLRRSGHDVTLENLTQANLSVDLQTRQVTVAANELPLAGKEYDLLVYFLQNPNIIITKAQIFERLWGFDSTTAQTVVEVYLSNLRKKLKQAHANLTIRTIRNAGYLLESPAGTRNEK